jgi:hypothetical protein
VRRYAITLFLCLLAAGALLAQTDRSTLRGTVNDPTGALVPGADIVITEAATNVEARRLTSDANGNYEAPGLKPGTYRVRVEKTGFRNFVADGLLLDAGQVRRVDMVLQVGTTADTITVSAGAALIQTETGAISGELDKKKFLDRPLVDVYPSPLALMTTMPGIQGNGWNLVMSGITDRNKQTWAMDGVPNDTAGDQNDNPAFFDTVQVNRLGQLARHQLQHDLQARLQRVARLGLLQARERGPERARVLHPAQGALHPARMGRGLHRPDRQRPHVLFRGLVPPGDSARLLD